MQFKIVFSFLFLMGTLLSYGERYSVIVHGRLVDSKGNGISNHVIYLTAPKGAKYTFAEKVPTYGGGEFKSQIFIHDSILSGIVVVSYVDCNGKEKSEEHKFSKENQNIELRLLYCERNTACSSEVVVKKLNDSISLAIVISKGKAPFTHRWSNGEDGDTIRFNPKTDARLCVKTTTADSCVSEACAKEIPIPCGGEIKIVSVNDSSSLAIVIPKGKAPFKFRWLNGSNDDTIRFNPIKSYGTCVTVVDAANCSSYICFSKPCTSTVLVKRINDSLAIAYVIAKGKGTLKHTWTTGETGDSIRFNPLHKIKICVRTVDSAACVSEACVNFIPSVCGAVIERSRNVLYAYLKGDVVKTYKWSTGSDDPKITIKEKGEYCVSMVGFGGCEAKACFKVEALDTTECKGEIIAEAIGSNAADVASGYKLSIKAGFPLEYIKWSTGEEKQQIVVSKTGEYCVTISDNINCKLFICKKVTIPVTKCTATIVQERLPSTSLTGTVIRLTAKPTFDPKIISWSTKDTTLSILVDKSGTYCVTLSDGKDCKVQECIKIEIPVVPPTPVPTFCSSVIIVKPISATEVKLLPRVDGKLPFTFSWSTGSKDAQISVTKTGMYCITITDGGGCVTKSCVEVEIGGNGALSPETDKKNLDSKVSQDQNGLKLSLFPNPAIDKVNFEVNALVDGDGQLNVTNLYGKRIYQEKINVRKGNSIGQLDLSFLSPGVYQVTFEQKGYMTTSKIIIGK